MGGLHLTAFDLAAIAIVLISSIMAFARGFLREAFSIVAFIGAALAVTLEVHRKIVAPYVEKMVHPAVIADVLTWILLFIIVFTVITVATAAVAKAVHKSGEIGAVDRALGLLFGAARGILVLALFVVLMRHVTGEPQAQMPTWLTEARTYPVISQAADILDTFVPEARAYINRKTHAESGAPPASSAAEAP